MSTDRHHRHSFQRRAIVPLLAVAAACSAPAAWAGQKIVPFTASVAIQETVGFNPACAPSYVGGSSTGSGSSTIGAISFAATDCITPGGTTYTFSNGKLTITAATGDKLMADYGGTLTPLPNPFQLPLYLAYGDYTITGGTGRYQGATGSGFLKGYENLATGQGSFDLTGLLKY